MNNSALQKDISDHEVLPDAIVLAVHAQNADSGYPKSFSFLCNAELC